MGDSWKYGYCDKCGGLYKPIWFTEKETKVIKGALVYTGRTRKACSHLECIECGNKEAIDDSFDGEWDLLKEESL